MSIDTSGGYHFRKRGNRKTIPLNIIPVNRLKLVFFILCLGLLTLSGRAAWLQIIQSSSLRARARSFQIERNLPLGIRRSIIDRNGKLVAFDEERYRLWAHPKYFNFPGDSADRIREPLEVATELSSYLSMSTLKLKSYFDGRDSGVRVKEGISKEVASQIKNLGISGIDLESYPQRFYPQGDLFANVIGFLNHDRVPQAGLERSLNKRFLRNEQTHYLRKGADGTPLPDEIKAGVFKGDDHELQLTLDTRLQMITAKELAKQVKAWNASKGVGIVMDASNGEILALASTPTYDPNSYWNYSPNRFKEWSVQDLFEPGSVFKPINLALALQEGVITSDGSVYDSGTVTVGGWPLKNWNHKANGFMNYAKVLEVSSNVGMVNIMQNLDSSSYWEWLDKLGISKAPDTDLPGAVGGQLRNKKLFLEQPIHHAVASFGQGFSITPLKLVQLHALIANGGMKVTPHITKGFSEDILGHSKDQKNIQVFSPEVTKTVLSWMESVVENGSGKGVLTPNYRIAGKTGTADNSQNGQSYTSKICSFVAILPVDKPRYVVLVAIDDPKKEYAYGSTVAVPVAKKIIESLLVIEKVPPTLKRT